MPKGVYKRTEKHKIYWFQKGHKFEYCGTKHPFLGKHHSEETKHKISENNKGKIGYWKGKKLSEKTRKKMSQSMKGRKSPKYWTGKKHYKETKKKMSLSHGGTGISQISSKRYYHLRDKKYMEWRSRVFERDSWTCQTCGRKSCYLEPHHIKGWSKYPKLRYEVENGVTLCLECHKLTRKKN